MFEIPPSIDALIFDCDGTLADTMSLHWEAWQRALDDFGIICENGFLERLSGVPTEGIIRELNRQFDKDVDPKAFTEVKENYLEQIIWRARPIEPVVALVHEYHGRLPMAVVSGGVAKNVRATLLTLEILDLFETLITADDPVSPKPAPDIFLEAARRIGVEPDRCQVFEDADAGIEGARAAGMQVIDVRLYTHHTINFGLWPKTKTR